MGGKVGFCGMKKAPIQRVGLMSGFQPRGDFARCGERLFFMFGLKPGARPGFQKGDSAVCGRRPACAAGSRRATGPDPFVACGRDECGGLGKKNQFTWEHASGELTFMR